VEAVFEGPAAAVERMIAFVRRGPDSARVERVEVVKEEPRGGVRLQRRLTQTRR